MNHVIRLSLAGYIFQDKARSGAAAQLLRTWFLDPETKMYPSLRFGQGIPGVVDGRASSTMDLYFSGRGFADAVLLLGQTPGLLDEGIWTVEDREGMRAWAQEFATYMATSNETISESRMVNNHGVFFDLTTLGFATIAGDDALIERIIGKPGCKDKNWCAAGRIAEEVDDKGMLVHEVNRADPGHYVYYTLYGSINLALAAAARGNDEALKGRPLRKAGEWAMPHSGAPPGSKISGRYLYAVQSYRMLSRALGSKEFEKASCKAATSLRTINIPALWDEPIVGADVLEITMPPLEEAEPCPAYDGVPRYAALEGKKCPRESASASADIDDSYSGEAFDASLYMIVANAALLLVFAFRLFMNGGPKNRKKQNECLGCPAHHKDVDP